MSPKAACGKLGSKAGNWDASGQCVIVNVMLLNYFLNCFWSKTSVKQRRWELWGAGCQLGAELGANPPGEGLDLRFLSALGILTFTSSQGLGRGFSRLIVQLGDVSQPCSPG